MKIRFTHHHDKVDILQQTINERLRLCFAHHNFPLWFQIIGPFRLEYKYEIEYEHEQPTQQAFQWGFECSIAHFRILDAR